MDSELQKIRRWRDRAEECRVDAEKMRDSGAKQTLLHIGRVYDELADRTEGRLRKASHMKAP